MKKIKIYILSAVCGLLAIGSIFLTIGSATSGAQIASLQSEETQALNQQQELQENLVQNLSISSLQEKSSELGFAKVSNLVYVGQAAGAVPIARLP